MKDLIDNPVEWGRKLIITNDHDPLYVGLTKWDVKGSRLRRFMLAYWCCYSVGASWFISQQSGSRFWEMLLEAARNSEPLTKYGYGFERWPRAHERRHWRGQKCVDSVLWLRESYRHPEEAVVSLERARHLSAMAELMDWPQFGPWIAFKAADMLERVLGVPVEFEDSILTMYKDPKEGAEMAAPLLGVSNPQEVADLMCRAYEDMWAPGIAGWAARACNIQEVETVLCKWKSARKGHYFIGKDTQDHRRELTAWGAQDLLAVYPTGKA